MTHAADRGTAGPGAPGAPGMPGMPGAPTSTSTSTSTSASASASASKSIATPTPTSTSTPTPTPTPTPTSTSPLRSHPPPPPSSPASPASPADRLAAGFAVHVAAWARRQGADDAAARAAADAAAAVSAATSEGHVCLALDELARRPGAGGATVSALRASLLASGVVGTPDRPGAMPLVLDDEGRLYLHRYFDHERRLAACLAGAAAAAPPFGVDAGTRALLDRLFEGNAAALGGGVDWQKVAVALALRGRLTVISGGPGTGKTTTVVNLLACLVAQDPGCRIALAAPTGKAAARMTEALRQRAAHLPEALRSRLPATASTVHRLLGATPATGGFVHHAGRPLAIDVLVVDEASMLDLALATRLLDAVPATARVVLLGDKDQLAAVESGAVFAELSADPGLTAAGRDAIAGLCGLAPERLRPPPATRPNPLPDTTVWFTRNFRFAGDSGIGRLAADINAARADDAVTVLRHAGDGSVRWLDERGAAPGDAALAQLFDGHAAFLEAVRRDPADRARVTAAFGTFRALCAVREGPRGVRALNDWMAGRAREALAPAASRDRSSPWFVGRPVMVLRNDPVLKLFNGDVGIALPDAHGETSVFFPDPDGGFRGVPPVRLPEHQTAFAMTVHKAQGSEFDEVLVVLPRQRGPVLTRELLYTAVTRARERVTLVCSAEVLAAAVQTPTRRHTGLLARLRDATATLPRAPTA